MRFLTPAIAALSLFTSAVFAAVPTLEIKGSKWFYSNNGTQFYIRGVAYQQDVGTNGTTSGSSDDNEFTDPLADEAGCKRDLPYLVQLRTNTLRVYAVDPTKNHDACMSMFADAGIYLIIDLSQPGESINRNTPSWTDDLYTRYTSVVDTFVKYPNTMGFFGGNEVSNSKNNTNASAFVKAAIRDMKSYVKAKKYRSIYFGYATNDDADIRVNLADYFDCGDAADSIDFWGYNIYSWCGDSSYQASGYADRTKEFSTYNVPFFFAEYGCNTIQPRKFTEVGALFGPQMSPFWSGGIVYMYFQEANDFANASPGLVTVSGNSVSTLVDFSYLSKEIATATPSGVNSNSYNPTVTAPQSCPEVGATWLAEATPLPPSPNEQLCQCMVKALSCVVSDSTSSDDYSDLFGTVCGLGADNCAGIQANATTGKYGAYSMCNPKEQLSFAFNQYYQSQDQANTACDFDGKASTQDSQTASGGCQSLINQAGSGGTGTVTSAPTGAGGSAAASSSGAAGVTTVPDFRWGAVQIGAYLMVAGVAGAAMILL
ncbi:beta-1,3-glucanosyltransferase [Rhizodiscina lignyota]|uniref:1,3-beta-glucanosyltransferase n=1 Tax=Rhizodiscina lignyota TaxID=1504668 RepID=A0A9P4M6H3_9PEZI|nr:beta-1,3-glucanosyltransferase [Rhizodiscina lignyota]